MARKNTNEELWLEISAAGVYRDTPTAGGVGDSTVDTLAAAGQKAVAVVAGTDFAAGEFIRLSGGNLMEVAEVASVATNDLTLVSNLAFAHVPGAVVKEVSQIDLGAVSEDGITRETTVERTEIRAATQAAPYANLVSSVGQRLTWNLLNHSLENVLLCLGLDEEDSTYLHGTGTTGDPTIGDILADDMGGNINQALWFTGALNDGTTFEIQGWGCEFDPNHSINYLRGQAVLLPLAADVQHIRYITPISF